MRILASSACLIAQAMLYSVHRTTEMNAAMADEGETKKTTHSGTAVAAGSFVEINGERMVSLFCNGGSACLSIGGARLLAKQINEWADIAEKNQGPLRFQYLVNVLTDAAKDAAKKSAKESVWQPVPNTDGKAPADATVFAHTKKTSRKPSPAKSKPKKPSPVRKAT